jgi:hypothetical protein
MLLDWKNEAAEHRFVTCRVDLHERIETPATGAKE